MNDGHPPALGESHRRPDRNGQALVDRRRNRAGNQAPEGAMAARSPPEHAKQERREQRRIDKGKHQLEDVHDVVERRGEVRRAHAGEDAEHRGPPTHCQVVGIRAVLLDMALIEVIGEDRVERGHIAGHSAHE